MRGAMVGGRLWGRAWLLVLVALACGIAVSSAAAARPAHPVLPNPIGAARYLAAQRAGYGPARRAARLAAKATVQARALRARPIPRVAGAPNFSGTWAPLGPTPVTGSFYGRTNTGRVDSVAVVPSGASAGEILIGTAGGGVWSSTDGGKTWQTHTDQASTGLAIGALAVDPSNPSTIYAGTGEANNCGDCFYGGGVLKSTDGGQTWTVQNPGGIFTGVDFASLAVDPRTGDVYAGTTNGLFVSADGGATWTQPAGFSPTNASDGLVLDPSTNPTTVYVATNGVGVQKSTDGGVTFTTLGGGLPAAASFGVTVLGIGITSVAHPTADQTLYAAVQVNGTTNPANGGDLEMFRSTDGGTAWTQLTKTPAYTNASYAYGSGTSDQASYDNTIAVDPANPNHVLAGGIAMVETTNGGTSWTNVNGKNFFAAGTNVIHPDFHALAFATSSKAFIGCDGGAYEYNPTASGPSGVSSLNTDQDTTQFYADLSVYNNGAQVLGGLQDNGTGLYTGKSAWPDVNSGDGGDNAINPLDPKQQFGEADANLYETNNSWADGGNQITPTGQPPAGTNFVPPIALIPRTSAPDSPTLFYGGPDLYVTHDPADASPAWSPVTHVGSGVSAIAVAPSNPNLIYVGFDDGTVLVSTNAQAATPTFTAITPAVGDWVTHIDVNPIDPGSIAISFSASDTQTAAFPPMVETGTVTGLTGTPTATYTDITGNLPTGVASNSVVFDGGSLAVATDVGVFSTSTPSGSATSWTAVGTGLPNVQVIGLTVAGNGDLYAATHGRGVWTLSIAAPPAPTVTGVSPASGPAAGGTAVTITGTNLTGATAVDFGAAAGSSVTVNSATQITATSPTGSGTVDVTVITPGGSSATSAADQFTYLPAPVPGTPEAQVTGSGAFGNQAVSTASAAHVLTIADSGSATLSIPAGGLALSGADAGQYTLSSDACSGQQLAPGGSCTVQVAFAPTSPGAHNSASVQISDNAPGSPQSVGLSGTGTQSSPTAQPPVISHLKQLNRRWRLGTALPKQLRKAPRKAKGHKTPVGTVLTFKLNVNSQVKLSFAQHLRRHRTGARGSFTLSARAGTDRIAFDGRLSKHVKLAPGTYNVTIRASDSAGRSRQYKLTFTIVK
jgi:hypothetical protein